MQLTSVAIALGALAAITVLNLCAVDVFAKIEAGLAITKVIVIMVFVSRRIRYLGRSLGSERAVTQVSWQVVVNFGDATMSFGQQVFPLGIMAVLVNMTVVTGSFPGYRDRRPRGCKNRKNPEESVPKACKSVTYRIALLYILPLILVILVYPL